MKKPKMITQEQAEKIIQQLNRRDRLIFQLAIETGLRISDVLSLKARQVSKMMTVLETKTGKYKNVELSDALLAELEPYKYEYLGTQRQIKILCDHEKWLFLSPRNAQKHLHRVTYHRRLKKAAVASCVNVSAHSTRKLYAMNKFSETGDIFEVQNLLNHKYTSTTAAYLDIDLRKIINATLLNELQKKSNGEATHVDESLP